MSEGERFRHEGGAPMSRREKLQNIFRTVMEDDDLVLTDDLTAADVPAWDSLAHVCLMFSIESEFGLQFEADQLTSFTTVAELEQFIERHATV
jgi:acyl carrier protein